MKQHHDAAVSQDELRERILDAATPWLSELERDSSPSLEEIADRCGVSKDVVLQHFGSVAELRAAVVTLWSERLSAWMTNA